MTLIEELLQLLEETFQQGYDAGSADMTSPSGNRLASGPEVAQEKLERLRREIGSNLSYGDEAQVDDPRSKYIDVQADLEFYAWYTQGWRD